MCENKDPSQVFEIANAIIRKAVHICSTVIFLLRRDKKQ